MFWKMINFKISWRLYQIFFGNDLRFENERTLSPSIKCTTKSLLSKSYFSLKCNLPKLGPYLGLPPMKSGPSCLVYKSGCIAPKGLAGGIGVPISGVCPLGGINSGDKHRPKPAEVLGDTGAGELHVELTEPPVNEVRLDWEGDGVRRSPLATEAPGEEHLMSKEAARRGLGDLLAFRSG